MADLTIQELNAKKQLELKSEAMKNDESYELANDTVLCLCHAKYLLAHPHIAQSISNTHTDCELILLGPITDEEHVQLQRWFIKRCSAYHIQKQLMVPQFAIDKLKKSNKRGYVCRVGDFEFESIIGSAIIVACCKAVQPFNIEIYS